MVRLARNLSAVGNAHRPRRPGVFVAGVTVANGFDNARMSACAPATALRRWITFKLTGLNDLQALIPGRTWHFRGHKGRAHVRGSVTRKENVAVQTWG